MSYMLTETIHKRFTTKHFRQRLFVVHCCFCTTFEFCLNDAELLNIAFFFNSESLNSFGKIEAKMKGLLSLIFAVSSFGDTGSAVYISEIYKVIL